MKSKINLKEHQDRAVDIFSPENMINPERLTRLDDHTVLFNRSTIPDNQAPSFFVILALDYQWRYKQKFEDVTVYYEVDSDHNILCGVYDLSAEKKISKRVLVGKLENSPYTYTEEIMEKLEKIITNT